MQENLTLIVMWLWYTFEYWLFVSFFVLWLSHWLMKDFLPCNVTNTYTSQGSESPLFSASYWRQACMTGVPTMQEPLTCNWQNNGRDQISPLCHFNFFWYFSRLTEKHITMKASFNGSQWTLVLVANVYFLIKKKLNIPVP